LDHLDVVNAFLNPKIKDGNIYMTLPEGCPEVLNPPKIIVTLRKALYGYKEGLRLWHDEINAFLLLLGLTQYLGDPNGYLTTDGILILLYVDKISMTYAENAAKAAIEVTATFSQNYNIMKHNLERQFIGIEIHRNRIGFSLRQKT
jgi:hypothetical protein